MSSSEARAADRIGIASAPRAMQWTAARWWHLLRAIVVTQLKLRDQSTLLGFGWSFLNPLLMLGSLFLFFNHQIGRGIEHYALYLLIGLVHFTHFTNSSSTAMTTLAVMRPLTCDTIFPKELLVIGAVVSSSVEFVISMGLCLVVALLSGVPLHGAVALLPLVVLLQTLFVLWLSLLLSTMYVFATDLAHIYQVFLRILFFVTPTFYSATLLGDSLASQVVRWNLLARLIDFSRTAILGEASLPLPLLAILLLANAIAVRVALAVFRRYEPLFAERL